MHQESEAAHHLSQEKKRLDRLEDIVARIDHLLKAKNFALITHYVGQGAHAQQPVCALIVRIDGIDHEVTAEILQSVKKSIFLLGPSTQQYLFLPRLPRRTFLEKRESDEQRIIEQLDFLVAKKTRSAAVTYAEEIADAERLLPGFVAYDWLFVEPLLQLFRKTRDQDFAKAVETGSYGEGYTSIAEVNNLLHEKKVKPRGDLSGIEFTIVTPDGAEVAIGLEDLSRGELKRVMIYAWLKANQDHESLVLIDEIETSFHPDWQSGIVRDLWDWAPENQYILATHSYDVCSALTPAHVCVLEPRLVSKPDGDTEPGPDASCSVKASEAPHGIAAGRPVRRPTASTTVSPTPASIALASRGAGRT